MQAINSVLNSSDFPEPSGDDTTSLVTLGLDSLKAQVMDTLLKLHETPGTKLFGDIIKTTRKILW
jgi:hypothetical protein